MLNQSANQVGYITFTLEEEIMHHLLLETAFHKRNGLLYGKLGISIAFFEYGRCRNNQIYIDFAKELKNSLSDRIDNNINLDFATGLCGYGWGIEYMMQKQFIDSAGNEIFADIDQRVMAMDIRRISNLSLETGLEGFLHYILIRLKGTRDKNNNNPFDERYLKDTYSRLQVLPQEAITSGLYGLTQDFFSYIDTGLLTYQLDIRSFINGPETKNEEDILSAKLGLADGLAGNIIRMIDHLCE